MITKKVSSVTDIAKDKSLNSRLQSCPIAIIGMASVFAETKNLSQFWDNIVQSVNAIKEVPENRWAIDDYYSDDKRAEDKTYCKRGGFLPEVDFDPMEFGLPPNILELTDVAQLMALVVARDVLADAGLADESAYDRDKMGIILGVGGKQQQMTPLACRLQGPVLDKVLKASGVNEDDRAIIIDKFKKAYIPWEENSFPGMLGNVIAGRIANRFDLGGTNCVVDAACAGSLAALKMAVSDLLEYRSETMISGGVCCDNSPFLYMSFSKTPAFTDGDDIRPFDENSHGMMIGEGVGMMVLKRLEDAERDGDRIYSVIKGIGSSSDGRFKSIYAPRPDGQLKALQRAYKDAGFDPLTCGLIEGHGTGTIAGDVAEFSALRMFFSEHNNKKQHIALGSIKSQIGHTKAAAGVAGMIKASLALYHKVLPATINIDKPNLALDIENSPLYVNNETRPWMTRADGVKRRAGISSFGFGGTNFHFVLEEYQATQTGQYRLNEVGQTILISEKDKTALIATLSAWENKLNCAAEQQQYVFNELVSEYPLKTPKVTLSRCGFVVKNATQAVAKIKQILAQLDTNTESSWSNPTGIYYRESGLDTRGRVVALFSGQGAQYVNMGRDLTCNFPSMLSASVQMDKQFSDAGLDQLSQTVFPIPVFDTKKRQQQEASLRETQHAQPAIGAFSAGLFNTFKQAGFNADFVAGHSFGELTALWAAEVISFDDYMLLAYQRGQAMMAPKNSDFDAGTMAAVVGSPAQIAVDIEHIKEVSIANYNSNEQVVIAGSTASVNGAINELIAKGYKVVKLPVSAAFHTSLVAHAQKEFADVIESVNFNSPSMPVFANGTANEHALEGLKIKASLKNHMLESVHFNKEVDNLYAAGGRVFIEFGPKNILTRLVDNILKDKNDVVTIAVNANPKKSADLQLRLAALEMAVLGLELGNIDPYSAQQRPLIAPKHSPLSMKLSAASVVSKKTQQVFSDALNDGFSISPEIKIVEKEVIKEVIVEKIVEQSVNVDANTQHNTMPTKVNSDGLSHSLERCIAQFVEHQSALLSVHKEYMQAPKAYAETLQEILAARVSEQTLPESLDKTLAMYHDFQLETLRVHETYLNNQTNNMQKILSVLNEEMALAPITTAPEITAPEMTAPEITAPVENAKVMANVAKSAGVNKPAHASLGDLSSLQQVMMSVVADKTGYPESMLELSMDMEADLGIDSIKRVEILGAIGDAIPDLPELDPHALGELRTLGEIVTYMQSKTATIAPAPCLATANANAEDTANIEEIADVNIESRTEATANSAVINTSIGDLSSLQQVMMSVVADKTGYPESMLELSMDMEADLGIDSIKRVEILGAIGDAIPDLPELDPHALGELRTLGEIVTYMQSKTATIAPAPCLANANAEATANIEEIADVNIESRTEATANSAVINTSIGDLSTLQGVMMSVVADKTGYPESMLELSMDMEADLGIDSIKRVEILGAIGDAIPDLPELDPHALGELRTLGEIVTYMQSKTATIAPAPDLVTANANANAEATANIEEIADVNIESRTEATANSAVINTSIGDLSSLQQVMMSVVADKTGYPESMLELSMDMEADLGIDSIKRVEILGAIGDAIPDLPELDPHSLGELRTLGEIVTYMQSKTATIAPAPDLVTANANAEATANIEEIADVNIESRTEATANSAVINTSIGDLSSLQQVMMSVVADKTGYPESMLELSMDMEADLGIDSIKRVEILGAIGDAIPDLPELDPHALGELRTLGEIVTYMQSKSVAIAPAPGVHTAQGDVNIEINNVFKPAPSATVAIKYIDCVTKQQAIVKGENLLLVDDGEGSAVHFAQKLIGQGWAVTVIKPAWVDIHRNMAFSNKVDVMRLSSLDEDELKTLLAIKNQWTSVVYLHPKTLVSGIEYPAAYKKGLQLAFLLAKLTSLAKNSTANRSSFVVLTRQGGAFAVENNEKNTDLVQAGLSGLVKTLAHEWPSVFCRVVDVATKLGAVKVANILFDEINDGQNLPIEVGYYQNKRLTLVSEKTDSYALKPVTSINKNSVFLVSGGARGITADCVIRLAQTYQAKFILLGRSEYDNTEPEWANGIDDEASLKKIAMDCLIASGQKATPMTVNNCVVPIMANREITKTMNAITNTGSLVEYVSADITDSDKVKDLVGHITRKWGDITGLIHGAGVLADQFIEQKTLTDFERVYSTKVTGLLSMLGCCQNDKIQHLVLFSSLAGFYGNSGQSDYAIANEILNKTAFRFKALNPETQVLSFNWGPWNGGMVTPLLKKMFTDRGVYIIAIDAGAQLLVSELCASSNRCPQILVGINLSGERDIQKSQVKRLTKKLEATRNPFFADHQINGHPVLPTVCAIAWMVEACRKTYPDYAYLGFENYQLLKGVVFDGSQAAQLDIDLKLSVERGEQLQIEVKISSVNKAGIVVFNYVASVLLAKNKTATPIFNGTLVPLARGDHCLYEDGTLFHGDSLQGIIAINECDQHGLLLSCQIDAAVKAMQGEFDVQVNNVFANDLVYQALIVWGRKQLGLLNLPTATLSWQVWHEVPLGKPFYLKMNMTENRNNKLCADVLLIDKDKQILAKVSGVQAIIMDRVNRACEVADKII